MKKEQRFIESTNLEVREEDGKRKIGGYAAVFNNFREKIDRGAFKNSLKSKDIVALWSHDSNVVLGRTGNGTLELREDDHGLAFDLDLPNSPWGENAFEAIKRGDVKGVSFGFTVKKEDWDRGENTIRTLKEIDLIEISPTVFPAYKQTEVDARKIFENWESENPKTMSRNARRLALAKMEG